MSEIQNNNPSQPYPSEGWLGGVCELILKYISLLKQFINNFNFFKSNWTALVLGIGKFLENYKTEHFLNLLRKLIHFK